MPPLLLFNCARLASTRASPAQVHPLPARLAMPLSTECLLPPVVPVRRLTSKTQLSFAILATVPARPAPANYHVRVVSVLN